MKSNIAVNKRSTKTYVYKLKTAQLMDVQIGIYNILYWQWTNDLRTELANYRQQKGFSCTR